MTSNILFAILGALNASSVKNTLESLGKDLQVTALSDWYNVTTSQFEKAGGKRQFGPQSNLRNLLRTAYPNHEWHDWMFKQTTKGFWKEQSHQRQFFDWAAPKLGISKMEDWYHVSSKRIDEIGGAGLLQIHDDSLVYALKCAFPDHRWLAWRFSHVPRKFWRDSSNQRSYFLWAATELGIDHPHGWYSVSSRQLLKLFGGDLLRLYGGSLQDALISVFPEHQFDRNRFFPASHSTNEQAMNTS